MTVTLVTGGAGFIGSHLVDALVERGDQVRVLDKLVPQVHGERRPPHLNPEAEYVFEDICNRDALSAALQGVSTIFHEAAEVGVGQSMYEITRYVDANTLGTAILLEEILARRDQIRKVIVASSMSLYGEGQYSCADCGNVAPTERDPAMLAKQDWAVYCPRCDRGLEPRPTPEDKPAYPTSVYAVTKQDQEQLCLSIGRAYQIPTVALRYFNAYGKRQSLSNPYTGVCAIFSSRLLNDEAPLVFEDGNQSRDFVHVSDIVQANLLASDGDGADYETVNVGTGIPVTISEVASMLAKGLDKQIGPKLVARFRDGDIRHCFADISRAERLLSFEPRVSLEAGMKDLLEWVQPQQADDRVLQATSELEERGLLH